GRGYRIGLGGVGGCGGVDGGDDFADADIGAFGGFDADFAGLFGDAFGGDLVGFQFEEGLVLFHDVAVGDVPLGEHAGVDGFAHGRDFDFDEGHEVGSVNSGFRVLTQRRGGAKFAKGPGGGLRGFALMGG